ncbi:MAG: hypothetical protein Q8P41_19150 [Pseudomonadota bacterium]|nr:hypothetical protein [Pseudomonadota bacterium]
MVILAALLGCVAAWRPGVPGRFDLVVPEGWTVTQNRRWLGNDVFTLADPAARATISLQLVHADEASARIPLDLLAETRALSMGRELGVENGWGAMHRIALDDHEAWAVTGQRRWKFAAADYTAVFARVGGRVAALTLQAPAGQLDASLRAWSTVLETLRFPLDRVPDDAPQFEVD